MLASSVPMAASDASSPFPLGAAPWRPASPPPPIAMELTDHLHLRPRLSTPLPTAAAAPPPSSSATTSRPNMTASSTITLAMLRPHFEEPLAQVAQRFGICVTLLKKICRRHGIARWPHRQISGLRKSIASMEHAIGYFEGDRRESYAAQLDKQRAKLELLLRDPTAPSLLSPSSRHSDAARPSNKLHDEDEGDERRSSVGSPNGVAFMYAPSRQSLPDTVALFHSPGRYDAVASAPALPPLQGVFRPEFPLELEQQGTRQFPYAAHYERSRGLYAEPRAVPDIPPLRIEPKPLLPPISSLGGPSRASW